jgi:hypothetical protein
MHTAWEQTRLTWVRLQDHITGLPVEVASTPFGHMIMPMLQPALEERLSNANTVSIGPHRPPAPSAATDSAAREGTAPMERKASVPHPAPSTEAVIEGIRDMDAKGNGEQARKAFQEALTAEMERVMAEGVSDEHEAGAEALKRVMVEVAGGLVSPPA